LLLSIGIVLPSKEAGDSSPRGPTAHSIEGEEGNSTPAQWIKGITYGWVWKGMRLSFEP